MTSSHFSLNYPPLYSDFFPAFHFHSPHPSYCTLMTSYFKRQRITAHPRLAWGFFLCKRAVTHPHCSHMPALTLWRRLNGTDQLHLKKTLDPIMVIGWARHRQNQIVQNYISKENSPEALSREILWLEENSTAKLTCLQSLPGPWDACSRLIWPWPLSLWNQNYLINNSII